MTIAETQPGGPPRRRHWILAALLEAGWAPVAVFILHAMASRLFCLYMAYPPTDIAMHFMGGVAIAFFFRRTGLLASRAGVIGTPNQTGLAILVFGLTCAAAVSWECAEFLTDRYLGTNAQLDVADTVGDMVVGIVGGIALLAGAALRSRDRVSGRP